MVDAVEVKDLSKVFNNKVVLQNVSFSVQKGEIFGLLGPSGAGKTTLLKIITGQLLQDSGYSKILETLSTQLKHEDYAQMGLLLDDCGLYQRLTCYQNLKIMAILFGLSNQKINEVLKRVELYQDKNKTVQKLSKGMYQRLAFARALIHQPRILFLDEPTSGLDPVTTSYLHEMILDLASSGTTIILTTHNMDEATRLCDNVGLLHEGKIIEYGSPELICRRHSKQKQYKIILKEQREITLGNSKEDLNKIAEYFLHDEIESIHSLEATLLSVFVSLTGRELE